MSFSSWPSITFWWNPSWVSFYLRWKRIILRHEVYIFLCLLKQNSHQNFLNESKKQTGKGRNPATGKIGHPANWHYIHQDWKGVQEHIQYECKYLFFLLCTEVRYTPLSSFHASISLQSLSYCDTHFLYMTFYRKTLLGRLWRPTYTCILVPFAIVTRFLSCEWPQLNSADMASLICLHPCILVS